MNICRTILQYILMSLFGYSCSLSAEAFPRKTGVIGTEIRLREEPKTNSQIIGELNSGDMVHVELIQAGYHLIGMYYGRWCRVSTNAGKKGWMLSCFLKEVDDHGPFHMFAENFRKSWEIYYVNIYKGQKVSMDFAEFFCFPLRTYLHWDSDGMLLIDPRLVKFASLKDHDDFESGILRKNSYALASEPYSFSAEMEYAYIRIVIRTKQQIPGTIFWLCEPKKGRWVISGITYVFD